MTTTKTPYYPQLAERDCGATCLRMVAEHYGLRASMATLREATRTSEAGTDLGGIEAGAQLLGFETLAADLPYDELAAGDLLPAILHWDRDHFVVLASADRRSAHVLDPAMGPMRMSRAEFEAHRFGPGRTRAGLVLRHRPGGEPAGVPVRPATPASAAPLAPRRSLSLGGVWLATALVLVGAAAVAWVFATAVTQAVDLQFREAWVRQLGALLLATAGLGLGVFLLRRACLAYGIRRSQLDGDAIADVNLGTPTFVAAEHAARKRADAEALVGDADEVRNWFAYDMPPAITAICVTGAGLGVLLTLDGALGLAFGVAVGLCLVLGRGLRQREQANRSEAASAAAARLAAEREHAASAGAAESLGSGDWLDERLARARARADVAFVQVAGEYGAQRQLIAGASAMTLILLIGVALYQLGFGGLQLGTVTSAGVIGVWIATRIPTTLDAWARWDRLRAARLRLSEARLLARDSARATSAPRSARKLDVQTGEGAFACDLPATVAFVGPDAVLRRAITSAILGFADPTGPRVRASLRDAAGQLADAADLGRLAVVRAGDDLLDATIAENISLSARPDSHRLEEAAHVVGLLGNDFPHGLATRPGELGEADRAVARVRVLLARAVYAEVDAVLIDGATEELSAYEESLLLDALVTWGAGKTILLNTSRVLSAYGFGQIAYVAAGEIESAGTHESLMARRGAYFYEAIAQNPSKR